MYDSEKLSSAKTLVMGSGGYKGAAMLGILDYLDTHGHLKHINKWIGVSVGAILAYLTIMGYNAKQIMEIIQSGVPESDLHRSSTITLFSQLYLTTPTDLRKYLIIYTGLSYPGNGNMTLKKMHELTGHHFIAVSYDVISRTLQYLDHETAPDMLAVDAVIASCSLPFIYPPVLYNDKLLVDGAMGDEFPISKYDDGETPIVGIWATGYPLNDPGKVDSVQEQHDTTQVHPYMSLFDKSKKIGINIPILASYMSSLISAPMLELAHIRHSSVSDNAFMFVIQVNTDHMYTKIIGGNIIESDELIQLFMDGLEFAKHLIEQR